MAGSLGSKRWNRVSDEILEWALAKSDMLLEELLSDGPPPGKVKADPYQEYLNLQAMAAAKDPLFMSSNAAQQRLLELSAQFGRPGALFSPPGTIQGEPLSPPIPLDVGGLAKATFYAQRNAQQPGVQ